MGQVVQLFPHKKFLSRHGEKLEAFKEGLDKGVIMITLDATRQGVSVPSQFSRSTHLSLNYSYRYNLPDFAFDEEGVSATLSFDEGYFYCLVPWEAVYRIGDRVWPDDFP
jgi:hypothetical protein